MSKGIYCHICKCHTNLEVSSNNSYSNFLRHHLKKFHDISSIKDYYDNYIKKEKEGVCQECGIRKTTYLSFSKGYKKLCHRCSCQGKKASEKRRNTNLEKYGVEHNWMKGSPSRKVCEETNLKKYGVKNIFEDGDYIKSKMVEKYGVTSIQHLPEYIENLLLTNNEKFKGFKKYKKEVLDETKKWVDELFRNWDGKCYYTNRLLVDNNSFKIQNPNKHVNSNLLQPTVDHKISIMDGWKKSISVKYTGSIKNLCICGRSINCRKHIKSNVKSINS